MKVEKSHKAYWPHEHHKTHGVYHYLLPFPLFHFSLFTLSLFTFFLTSCNKVEETYSRHVARFVFQNTQSVTQLNSALNSLGEFCTITARNNQYIFHSPGIREDFPYERTAADVKAGYVLGLSGLIVGIPILTEQLSNQNRVVCFDLACPKCYEDNNITRAMTLKENQHVVCGRCNRSYDLNTQGIADDGSKLYRYQVSYGNNTLVINNQ